MNQKNQIFTKSAKPISEKTFGTLVSRDKICRHAAVDLDLYDPDLRLLGRYLHYCGYRNIKSTREVLISIVKNGGDPFVDVKPFFGKVISFKKWKSIKGKL